MDKEMGGYAFSAGLLLSAVLGLVEVAAGLAWLVALFAVAVAILNIQAKETMKLLLWTIGMGVVGVGAVAVEELPLQVREFHKVVVDQTDVTNAYSGQL
jgi:hypothetical protein